LNAADSIARATAVDNNVQWKEMWEDEWNAKGTVSGSHHAAGKLLGNSICG